MANLRFEIRHILAADAKTVVVYSGDPAATSESLEGAVDLARQLSPKETYGMAIVDTVDGSRDLRFLKLPAA